ncbi:MAG TPA: VanZ family protein [Balneolaceae bacterium]|nr:VanZ family protein [Balneolaceae bacterium]
MIEAYYNWLIEQKALILTSFIATTIGIIVLTLMPPENLGSSKLFQYDKLGHFFIFFIWTFLFALSVATFKNRKTPLFIIFLAGSFFGFSIEILQHLTPFGRSANFIDAVADIAGSLAAVLLLRYLQYQTKGR